MTAKKTARLAGLVYLILVISGVLNLVYLPPKFIVWKDPAKTFDNVIQLESLFRLNIVCGIICFGSFLILPLVLYKLLHKVNKTQAMLMVALSVVSVPISFVSMIHQFSVLTLIGNDTFLKGFTQVQLQTEMMLHFKYYYNGVELAQIFWGLWLFPFGYLVYKSGFLPKFLGVFLMLGCVGYLIAFFGNLLFPSYPGSIMATIAGIPSSIGEIGTCLWLLIMGAKENKELIEK